MHLLVRSQIGIAGVGTRPLEGGEDVLLALH